MAGRLERARSCKTWRRKRPRLRSQNLRRRTRSVSKWRKGPWTGRGSAG